MGIDPVVFWQDLRSLSVRSDPENYALMNMKDEIVDLRRPIEVRQGGYPCQHRRFVLEPDDGLGGRVSRPGC